MNKENYKFTQGKWEINPRALRNVRCGDSTIANCSQGQSGDNELEERYNALLISKSPEMLEMLKEILLDLEGEVLQTSINDTLNKAKNLIKEATELKYPEMDKRTHQIFNKLF